MQTRSKRFLEIQKLRENKKEYDVPTAISLLKQTSSTKFVESAEAHFRLNIDPKYNDQQLRATVLFYFCLLHLFFFFKLYFSSRFRERLVVIAHMFLFVGESAQGDRPDR